MFPDSFKLPFLFPNLSPSPSPPHAPPSPRRNMNSGAGTNMDDSMALLGFNADSNAKERDVIIACRNLARKHHPDKNDPSLTGVDNAQATAFF